MMGNNIDIISNITGVPKETIKNWKYKEEWWDDLEREIRESRYAETNKRLRTITEKAAEAVMDRVENGDYYYDNKKGVLVRKPVTANVVNKILVDSIDKQVLLDKLKKDEKKEKNDEEIRNRLARLSEEFSRFARAKTIDSSGDLQPNQPDVHQLVDGKSKEEVR